MVRNTARTRESTATRRSLSAKDWVDAAIDVMVNSSVEQVRVERLAVDLQVSKGSFYWHFRSREELLAAILDRWIHTATLDIQERIDKEEPRPDRRLLLFMQLPLRSPAAVRGGDLELAILGWARRSPAAMQAVDRVNCMRMRHTTDLFMEMGASRADAQLRAHKTYAFIRYAAQRRDLSVEARKTLISQLHSELIADCRFSAAP